MTTILFQDNRYTITTLPEEIAQTVRDNPPVKPTAGRRPKLVQAGDEFQSRDVRREWGL